MAASLLPISSSSPHSLFSQRPHYSGRTPLTHHSTKTNLTPLLCSPVSQTASSSNGVSIEAQSPVGDADKLPQRGCKACGREEVERGCNGEGRVQGGIATVPGFGWWPIKAFRPCPGFVASGGRYRRRGQSMDEVAWGRVEKEASASSTDEVQSSKKRQRSKRSKGK